MISCVDNPITPCLQNFEIRLSFIQGSIFKSRWLDRNSLESKCLRRLILVTNMKKSFKNSRTQSKRLKSKAYLLFSYISSEIIYLNFLQNISSLHQKLNDESCETDRLLNSDSSASETETDPSKNKMVEICCSPFTSTIFVIIGMIFDCFN